MSNSLWPHQAPLSMGFPRQECWSGLLFPSPGDFPDPGVKPISSAFVGGFFTTEPWEKPLILIVDVVSLSCVQFSTTSWTGAHQVSLLHYLPEFAQTHVHWVSDSIQASHPLLPPSPPTINLSQHQGLFQRVNSSHQVAKVLELQLRHKSFQWIFRVDY